jgi:hypothetical protein
MTFLEPIIAVAIGVAATIFAARFNKSTVSNTLKKYGPLAQKAYNIIDPALDQNMRNWSGSQVDATFEVVVETLADGELTPAEIKRIATDLAAAWLPAAAAEKVRNYEKNSELLPQVKTANVVAQYINGVADKSSVFTAVRKYIKN